MALAIRSKDRDASTSESSSDFRIRLNQPIQGSYYLSHALTPNTSYTVCGPSGLQHAVPHA